MIVQNTIIGFFMLIDYQRVGNIMKSIKQDVTLFSIGGLTYGLIEILWRHHTHWTMLLTGGICFLSLFKLFTKMPKLPILEKCVLGSVIITIIEFTAGCVVNIWLKMNVWDYSHVPFNLLGQICVLYSTLWGFLCIPINKLCISITSGKIKIPFFNKDSDTKQKAA